MVVRTKLFVSVILILLAVAVFFVLKISWYGRYVWPAAVSHMQDLPALDRNGWPTPPATWRTEVQAVEVATPQGLEVKDITYHANTLDMDFVEIPQGSFVPQPVWAEDLRKLPLRRASRWRKPPKLPTVTISHPFYLGAFEVTNSQFELFDPSHRERRPRYQLGKRGDNHPVQPVTWQEAQQYARWLSNKEGRLYRLPTAAEFKYATAAGTTTRLYWGNAFWDRTKANFGGLHSNLETAEEDGFQYTAPVGTYPANPWGLYDMLGNAYEWASDWWYPFPGSDTVDPTGPQYPVPVQGHFRMAVGGSWTTRAYSMYMGEDDGNNPADLVDIRGFRLVAEIEQ